MAARLFLYGKVQGDLLVAIAHFGKLIHVINAIADVVAALVVFTVLVAVVQ